MRKKESRQAGGEAVKKARGQKVDMDELRELVQGGVSATDIMRKMSIRQIGSLRNAVFMLSQIDQAFYTVYGLVDETKFRPLLKVGKTGIRIPLDKLPFAKGTLVAYETLPDEEDGTVTVKLVGTWHEPDTENEKDLSVEQGSGE